jgi:hypothetical protein
LRAKYKICGFFRHLNVWVLIALLWLGVVFVRYRGELPPLRQFPWWDAITPPRLLWSRPAAAPNGKPWPTTSSYISGYPRLNVSGHVSVVADNSGSLDDVLVKLYDRDRKPMSAVRVVYVQARDKFTMERVKPGHYDVRYLDLTSGVIKKSQPIRVKEDLGWTVGLYGVVDGTQYHQVVGKQEF